MWLQDLIQIIIDEKHLVGCDRFELMDEVEFIVLVRGYFFKPKNMNSITQNFIQVIKGFHRQDPHRKYFLVKVFSLFSIRFNFFRGLDFDRQVNLFIIFLGV